MIDFGTIFGRFYLDFGRFGVDFGLDLGPAWIDFARNLELLGPSLGVTIPWDPRVDSRSVTMRPALVADRRPDSPLGLPTRCSLTALLSGVAHSAEAACCNPFFRLKFRLKISSPFFATFS